jgi:hypothetical protein|tara:strand:+ start:309 stop:905 length:597 start_codon:yes stop_codon:yes gene_type:complete
MKTNFLHFKSVGTQTFTYASGAQTVVINGAANWDVAITNKNQVTVTVIDATDGSSNAIAQAGLSLSTNDLTIAAASSNGFDLGAGDIITVTVIPTEDTEAIFRADRFLGVQASDATADTLVVLSFKSMKSVAAAAGDDTITFTIADDGNVALMKNISLGVLEALNADKNGGTVTVLDRLNKTGTLAGLAITKMVIAVA